MPFDLSTAQEVDEPTGGFDINSAQIVDDSSPSETVYRQETGEVINAPSDLQPKEIEYLDDTQNKGAESGLGFNSVKDFIFGAPEAAKTGAVRTGVQIASDLEVGFTRQVGEAQKAVFAGEEPDLSIWGLLLGSTTQHSILQARLAKKVFGEEFVKEAGVEQANKVINSSKNIQESNDKFIAEMFPKKEGGLGVVQDIFGGFTTILASVGLTVATKSPAASTAFFSEIQENAIFNESMEKGFNNLDASEVAVNAKTIEGGLEALGGTAVLQIFKNGKGIVRHAGVALEEAVQEFFQTGGEEAVTQMAGVRDVDLLGAVKNMFYSAFIGFVGGGSSSVIISTITKQGEEKGLPKEVAANVAKNIEKQMPAINNEVITALEDQISPLKDTKEAEANFVEQAKEVFKPEPTDEKRIAAKARAEEISELLLDEDTKLSEVNQKIKSKDIVEGTPEYDTLIKEKKAINKERNKLKRERSGLDEIGLGQQAQTLRGFIKRLGGIKDIGGDLKSRDFNKKGVMRGVINNKTGVTLDAAREVAVEAGFIQEVEGDQEAITTTDDLLNMLDREAGGQDAFRKDQADLFTARKEKEEAAKQLDEEDYILEGIEEFAKESGFDINRQEAITVFELERDGVTFEDAIVHVVEQREEIVEPIAEEEKPALPEAVTEDKEFMEDVEKISEQETGLVSNKQAGKVSIFFKDFGVGIERVLTPISTRIKAIDERLFNRFRRFEFNLKRAVIADHDDILPFLKSIQKLDKDTWIALDLAMKNGDEGVIHEIAVANNITEELAAVEKVLDDIFDRAVAVGMDIKYRWDFFPRRVKDVAGLLDHLRGTEYWSVIQEAITNKEKRLDKSLTNEERIVVVNQLLKGFNVEGLSLAKKGVFKERSIEKITVEINQYYETSDQALLSYIAIANDAIETSRLFGRGQDIDGASNIDDSVGFFVNDMVNKGQISTRQANVLKEIFHARFNSGRMGYIASAIRDLSYIDVMGSPLNAITQIGDLATSLYNAGVIRTAIALPRAVVNKSKVNLKDVGVEHIAEEFASGSFTSQAVTGVFKATGLHKIDSIGKLVLVNSAFSKFTSQAKKGNKKLLSDLDLMFEGEAGQVRQDLIDGNITENVRFMLNNKLLDMQPMAKSEMPQYYLTNGNLKILYMLKTFTIRQLDIYRREVFSQLNKARKTGDPVLAAQAMGNLVRLAGFWIVMGSSADYMKDWLRSFFDGDEIEEPEDYVLDNILKAFGFSRYQLNMVAKTSPIEVGQQMFLPPAKFFINVSKDFRSAGSKKGLDANNSRSIRSIPIGGELYYFWFGGGRGSQKKKKGRKRSSDPLAGL